MSNVAATISTFADEQRSHRIQSSEKLDALKQAVIAPLSQAEVARVDITFEGYGDSGAIEEIACLDAQGRKVACLAEEPPTDGGTSANNGHHQVNPLLRDLEDLAYLALELHHPGWEINEGASGSIEIDVATRSFVLDCNIRYVDYDNHSTAL